MVSARGKRLGDMFAGTYVIQERVAAPRRPAARVRHGAAAAAGLGPGGRRPPGCPTRRRGGQQLPAPVYELPRPPATTWACGSPRRCRPGQPAARRRAPRPPPTWPPCWPSAATASTPGWPASSPARGPATRTAPAAASRRAWPGAVRRAATAGHRPRPRPPPSSPEPAPAPPRPARPQPLAAVRAPGRAGPDQPRPRPRSPGRQPSPLERHRQAPPPPAGSSPSVGPSAP